MTSPSHITKEDEGLPVVGLASEPARSLRCPTADDELCHTDDLLDRLIRQIMVVSYQIAETEDAAALDRLRDQQARATEAFLAGRRHIVRIVEDRQRARLNTPYQFRGAA